MSYHDTGCQLSTQRSDRKIRLVDLARIHPSRISMRTLRRWVSSGLLNRYGDRVVLRSIKIGGERYTTVEWYEQFIEELNA